MSFSERKWCVNEPETDFWGWFHLTGHHIISQYLKLSEK